MDINEAFQQAVAASKTINSKPSNEILLKLYSLYKQATEGDAPSEVPHNPFDFIAKAKHEAWAALEGMGKEHAMKEYISLIDTLKG